MALAITLWCREMHVQSAPAINQAELLAARESGRRAAEAVAQTQPGSMAREKAILDIRAREYRIRTAGFDAAADAFATAAEEQLKADHII